MLLTAVSLAILAQTPIQTPIAPSSDGPAGAASTPGATASAGASRDASADSLVDPTQSLIAPPSADKGVLVTVAGGGGYVFRTDMDQGGDVAITRFTAGTQIRLIFTEQVSLGLDLGFNFDRFEFGDGVFPTLGSNVDPWRDIYTVGMGAIVNWKLDSQWSVSGGLIGQFSGEESVDIGDGASGGGLVAAACQVNKDLLLGGGFGVVSRIEDDAAFFPTILIDWRINDSLRLTTRGGPTAVYRQALELVWAPAPPFELAVGARYETERFRLSEDNTYSDGIGQEKAIPVWLRATWLPAPNIRVDCFGGVVAWTELQLSDSGGGVLAEDDVDPAPFVAAYLSIKF